MEARVYEALIPSPMGLGSIREKVVLEKDYNALLERMNSALNTRLFATAEFEIDYQNNCVKVYSDNKPTVIENFTVIELKILTALLKRYNNGILSRAEIVKSVWGETALSVRNIDTHICHIREKLKEVGYQIKCKRSEGYYLTKGQ